MQPLSAEAVTSIVDGLKKLYNEKLKPLEVAYRFNDFVTPTLVDLLFLFCLQPYLEENGSHTDCILVCFVQTDSDFESKPQVMLLGQYSTGKTTFIKHLLRTSYPGAHIGPEPTTDRFVCVMVSSFCPKHSS